MLNKILKNIDLRQKFKLNANTDKTLLNLPVRAPLN